MVALVEREEPVVRNERGSPPALSLENFYHWRQRCDIPPNTVSLGTGMYPELISDAALERSRAEPRHSFAGFVRQLNGDCDYLDEIRYSIPSRSVSSAFAVGIGAVITGAQLLYGGRLGGGMTWDDTVSLKAITGNSLLQPIYSKSPQGTAGYELNVRLGVQRSIGFQRDERAVAGLFIFPGERAQAEVLAEYAVSVLELTRDPKQTVKAVVAEAERLGIPCRKNPFLTPTS